ncbi:MAG: sodium:solute symporter family protein [Planctomycetes bacterium]|nr:sodium:solute symporter family protein [Planctomycetota bacterium]MBL7143535.1 sodium:solute symporter family protein [Phycisphaerae bacterium]
MTYLIAIFVYLLVLTGIGIYKSRQVKTQADFSVAGRTLSPWILVCTMLACWIGTGSIVGNAGKTYEVGMSALWLPCGTFIGMILLSFIATRARNIEALSVPEIIGKRFGGTARILAVVALILAYMVIVSYQFNAGGMVLEVITGKKNPVTLDTGSMLTMRQVRKGYFRYEPPADWTGVAHIGFDTKDKSTGHWSKKPGQFTVLVVPSTQIIGLNDALQRARETGSIATLVKEAGSLVNIATSEIETIDNLKNIVAIKRNTITRITIDEYGEGFGKDEQIFRLAKLPMTGKVYLHEPKLTSEKATIIAAAFIVVYTMLAGLMSLAFADIVTGIVIMGTLLIAFPIVLIKAGGFAGMAAAFAEMGDRPDHMRMLGVWGPVNYINFCLPVFLLVLGDANQYQRIFASRDAKGAKTAVIIMIFVALLIEELIIAEAWFASSLIPDPENGRYVLIYAARHFMPLALGLLFMIAVVGIIISTADSFLLVPATTFIKDIYQAHINPKASEKRIVFMSRLMVLSFGIIAWLISLAFAESTTVFEKALYAFTIYGSAITPCLVAALLWKRATTSGAISSILAGTVTTLLWEEVIKVRLPAELAKLDAVLPAITLSVICLVVVSLLTQKKQPTGDD